MSLSVNDLTFAYRKQEPVFEHLSFHLSNGQVMGLIGPNGTGKSTLIRCINRVLQASSGQIQVDGKEIHTIPHQEIGKYVGYVPQETSCSFPLSVIDAVFLGRIPYGRFRFGDEDKKQVFEILDQMGLNGLAFRNLNELSGGERQRVLLARALVQQPRVLLLDEPTSNLDIRYQLETLETVRKMAKEKGLCVVISIHDLNLAIRYSDQALLMRKTQTPFCGNACEVITSANIRQIYGVETEVGKTAKGLAFVNPLSVSEVETKK